MDSSLISRNMDECGALILFLLPGVVDTILDDCEFDDGFLFARETSTRSLFSLFSGEQEDMDFAAVRFISCLIISSTSARD